MPSPDAAPSVRVSAVRARIEHAGDPLLRRLAALPRWAPVAFVVALVVLGLILRGVGGAVCFGLLTLLLGWMLYLGWPRIEPLHRLMRGSVLLLAAAVTVVMAASS